MLLCLVFFAMNTVGGVTTFERRAMMRFVFSQNSYVLNLIFFFIYFLLPPFFCQCYYKLTNADGEITSHISGMFARTIRMMELGIKPVWVFDGKPPDMKGGEIAKRQAAKKKAQEELQAAEASGDVEAQNKFSKRNIRVGTKENDDIKLLFSLMGVPVVEAPCEAEAQCAALAAGGLCFAAASEDMDTLCFNSPILLRKFTAAESKKIPVLEINLARVLEELGFTYPEFVDLCMLLGCDYMDKIKGMGPVKALAMMKEHRSIEAVIEAIKGTKYTVPENFDYVRAREVCFYVI
jgi:flap endonuclease-1